MSERALIWESPALLIAREHGELVGQAVGDEMLTRLRCLPDPAGKRGERQGRRVERAKRKRERRAGVETIVDRRLPGEG